MRILQLHTRYRQAGGEDSVVEAEFAALRSAGHEVHQHIEENPPDAIRAAVTLAGSLWNVRSAGRVAATVDRFRPDVAHVHNTWFASSPSVLGPLRRRRVPVVMTIHNYRLACANSLLLRDGAPCESCLDGNSMPAVRHRCYRNSRVQSAVAAAGIAAHRGIGTWSRSVDRFIVLSDFSQQRMIRAGLPADRLLNSANFVADPGPRPQPPSRSDRAVFVGRISAEKGLSLLLQAWAAAAPHWQLDVIGDGPERERLERGAPPGVTFLGRRPRAEVLTHLRGARALFIPSIWYEGQPVTALEGLASGTPLVLSDIGGLPEVLGGTSGGWRTPPGDVGGLVAAIDGLRDDTEVDARGRAARARYLEAFTPGAAVHRLQRIYRNAASSCRS